MFNVVRWSAVLGLAVFVAASPLPSMADQPQKSLAEELKDIKKELQNLEFDLMVLEHPRLSGDFAKLKNMSGQLEASAVTIETKSTDPKFVQSGSGFFVTATGQGKNGACEIATDNHVLKDTVGPTHVYLQDGSKYEAEVELRDEGADVAVLKINGVADPARTCPVLSLGTSADVQPGSAVMRVSPEGVTPGFYESTESRKKVTHVPLDPAEIPDRPIMSFEMDSRKGNSGSAIVVVSGKVVSLTWAAGRDSTGGTPVEALQRDLDKIHAGK